MRKNLLCALVLGAVALSGCRGWSSDKPPVHWNPNMDTQEKGKAFRRDQSGVFANDGRYMRHPPDGTVARGYLADDDELNIGMDTAGKPLAKLPDSFTIDANTVARGQNRYGIYCAPCHGKDADGLGLVAARPQALAVPPPSFKDKRLVEMPVGQMYKAIHEGVNNNNMPSYAVQIPVKDRWAIVAFLCTLQTGEADPTKACAKVVVDHSKDPPGMQLWAAKGCNACHTLDGAKGVGPSWKGLGGSKQPTDKGEVVADEAYLIESIKQPNAKVVTGFPPAMPALPLTDDEVKQIVSFILTDPSLK